VLSFLLKFIFVLNSVFLFCKLFVFEFLLGTSDICSVSAPHLKIVPLLDVHQLLMLSAGTFTYSESTLFSLTIFYML
jgi:hypothetical protein